MSGKQQCLVNRSKFRCTTGLLYIL